MHKPAHVGSAIATVLSPPERSRVEAAGGVGLSAFHARSVGEAIRTVKERPVNAVLLSPGVIRRDDAICIQRLVREFPGVPTVAVLCRHDAIASRRLLELGSYGVRRLVDLSHRDGLRDLRSLLHEENTPTSVKILSRVSEALDGASPNVRKFFEVAVSISSRTPTVRRLCETLDVPGSTFMSRFFRAGLPSPKSYLAGIRLLHAAALFEVPGLTVSDVALRLEYSSPQSFGRHVKTIMGCTAGEFRHRFSFATALNDFVRRMILPFQESFATFDPL